MGEQLTVKQKEGGVWEPILGFERGDGYMKIYQMPLSKFMQLFIRKRWVSPEKKIKNQFLLIKWLHTTMTSQATKRDKIFTHIEPTKDNYLEDINVFNQGTEEGNG